MIPPASPLANLEASRDTSGVLVGRTPRPTPTIVVLFASWCVHCRAEFRELAALRGDHPDIRILGVNYKGHEEYDDRGNAAAVKAFVADTVPWLRVIPADDALFAALGSPPKIPTTLVFDAAGVLVDTFDRRTRPVPTAAELAAALGH